MSLADQEADSINAELSSYQGIFVSSYSTNFNVHYTLAMTAASTLSTTHPLNLSFDPQKSRLFQLLIQHGKIGFE